jgi:AraC-like DNA-binding protein
MDTPTAFSRAVDIAVLTAAAETSTSPEAVCARVGVDPALLGDPAARVPHEVLARVWDELGGGDDAFGLRAARRAIQSNRSIIEYVFLNAADARGALEAFVRLQRAMHSASAHALEVRASSAVLRFSLAPPLRLPRGIADYLAASLVLRLRALLAPPVEPIEVRLPRAPFADATLAAEIFRAPVVCGAPFAEIHWPRHVLDRRLASADPTLHALLVRELEGSLGLPTAAALPSHGHAGDDVVVRLKRALRVELARGDGSLGRVARSLAMSGRSLERRLAQRGTSFQAVRDEVRRALAEELLLARGVSVAEASLAAGFSEVAAFSRAFRRWTGRTPTEFVRERAPREARPV